MPIEFTCSQCGAELRVREEDVGKKARCPRCGMIHNVPRSSDLSDGRETVYHPGLAETESPKLSGYERWLLKTPNGQVYGPVDKNELDSWMSEGRISVACLLQVEGQSHWQSALAVYPNLSEAVHELDSSSHAGHPYGHRHWVGTQPVVSSRARSNNGGAVLVMGILGLIFVFIPIFALLAWFMGHSERRAIARGEASGNLRWMVDVGYILGIIGSIIGCLTFFSCCLGSSFVR